MTFIGIDTRGIPALEKLLRELPQEVKDYTINEISDYLLNVLRENAPQHYVSRKSAYGVTFFTAKQRRWFFANLRSGALNVPYRRTQGLSKGWHKAGEGEASFLYNESPGAEYVIGDGTQSRHEAMVGWKPVSATIREREAQINRRADAAAQKAIKKLGG
jgi:hypothetical protein